MINDILDFSKIEARKLDLEMFDFDVRTGLESVVEMLAPKADEKDWNWSALSLRTCLPLCGATPAVCGSILVNLVGNAIKFTHQGEVIVRVSMEGSGIRDWGLERHEQRATSDERTPIPNPQSLIPSVTLRFAVTDTGIGVADDRLDALFSPFVQVDGSTTRKYGGTGLGLAIAKQLVELMGGRIGVESEPGKGSTFWITVVFEKRPDGPLPAGPARTLRGLGKIGGLALVRDIWYTIV